MMYLFKVKGQSTEEIIFITCLGKERRGSGDSLLVKKKLLVDSGTKSTGGMGMIYH